MNDNDTTPPDDLAVIRRPEVHNKFLVGLLEDTILVTKLSPIRLTRDDALNLAAWLLVKADEPVAFDHANVLGAVLSIEFVELLREVQNP